MEKDQAPSFMEEKNQGPEGKLTSPNHTAFRQRQHHMGRACVRDLGVGAA